MWFVFRFSKKKKFIKLTLSEIPLCNVLLKVIGRGKSSGLLIWKSFRKQRLAKDFWRTRSKLMESKRTQSWCVRRRTESQIRDEVLAGQKMSWYAYRADGAAAAAAATTTASATGQKVQNWWPGCGGPWSCRSPRNHHTFCRHSACTRTNCVRHERQQNVKYATRWLLSPPPPLSLSLFLSLLSRTHGSLRLRYASDVRILCW